MNPTDRKLLADVKSDLELVLEYLNPRAPLADIGERHLKGMAVKRIGIALNKINGLVE